MISVSGRLGGRVGGAGTGGKLRKLVLGMNAGEGIEV